MKKRYIKKIFKMLLSADLWTLEQTYRMLVNVTNGGGNS